jgi:hypothetical protein
VAVEDGGELACCGVKMQRLEVVKHVDVAAFDEGYFGFGELTARAFAIYVAADRGDGGDFLEDFQDGGFAYVAEVQDAFYALECGEDLGAEKAVGVADDADAHGFRIAGSVG